MAGKKRCFSTVQALRRLDPKVLCEVLAKFPDYLIGRKLSLPAEPSSETVRYDEVRDACMAGNIPHELDDVFFYVSMLGNKGGWDKIQREADFQDKRLNFKTDGLSCADLAMKAWLHNWPENKHVLEQSYARAKIHSRSSYVYFPPLKDMRTRYKAPTDEGLDGLRKGLAEYFIRQELGKGSNVVAYDYENEIWFLVRYPGQVERHPAINDEGKAASHVFKPEEYDAIVYHKGYGDLRLNTNRAKDHVRYRIAFADLLFGSENVFDHREKIVILNPLIGKCREIFKCGDIKGLAEIAPVEVCFTIFGEPGRSVVWSSEEDCSLLDFGGDGEYVLPENTLAVKHAKFRYRLKDRVKWETVTVHTGKTLNYERDGDSTVIEEWLRRRKFIKDSLGLFKNA